MDPTTGLSPAVLPLRLVESPSGPRPLGGARPIRVPKVASPSPGVGGSLRSLDLLRSQSQPLSLKVAYWAFDPSWEPI